jgi:glycosyltransferase involved in cell wall biosynthesis
MLPAGGIERVVSKHIEYFTSYASVKLLTKDVVDSFYPLPASIEKIGLGYTEKLDMHFFIYRILQLIKQILTLRSSILGEINKFKPDLVYCSSPINLIELYIYGIKLRNVIVTEHGSVFAYNLVYRLAKRYLYPKVKFIVAPTKLDYSVYSYWGRNAKYIPNPLPFEQNIKAKLNTNCILTIGRLTDDKQHNVLLNIWKEIQNSIDGWKLKIIGDGEKKSYLLQTIVELNLMNSVEIALPQKNIIDAYLNASIFVLTSRSEGFGMVLAEAMECGVPCIAFDCPSGPRDIIRNGDDGFLIDLNNKRQYFECLLNLMQDEQMRKKMGVHASINIRRFKENIVREEWRKLLNERIY